MQTSLQFQRFVYLLEYVNVVERHVLSGGPGRQPVVVVRVFSCCGPCVQVYASEYRVGSRHSRSLQS